MKKSQRLEDLEAVGLLILVMVLPLVLIYLLFTYTALSNLNSQNKALAGIVLYFIFFITEITISNELDDDHKQHRRRHQ